MSETAGERCARIYGPPIGLVVRHVVAFERVDVRAAAALYESGLRTDEVALELGVSVIDVSVALTAHGATAHKREPLRAGHPRTWNMICAGLATLEGSDYGAAA